MHEEDQTGIFSLLSLFKQVETRVQQQVNRLSINEEPSTKQILQPTARVFTLKAFKYIQIYLQQLGGKADANFASVCVCPPETPALTGQPVSSWKF